MERPVRVGERGLVETKVSPASPGRSLSQASR
jgi:hypothetical protein